MRRFVLPLVLLCLTLFGCGDDEPYIGAESGAVVVLLPEAADPAVERTVSALEKYVATMVGIAPTVVRLPASASEDDVTNAAEHERAGLAIVIDLAEQGDVAELPDGSYRIVSNDRGTWTNRLDHGNGATFVFLSGASKLADQYAIYELLRRLGARFYHPEQEWVPQVPRAQVRERARTATVIAQRDADGKPLQDYVPDFAARSYTFHGAHPLEHLEAFSDSSFPIDEAEHVEDWIVKNRGNRFRGAGRGIASQESRAARAQELDALRRLMGFPTGRGITLHNQQQGATAVVDPNSSVPPRKQIEDYVDAQLDGAGDDVTEFGIHFGPTEFTVTPDQETVQSIRAPAVSPDVRTVAYMAFTEGNWELFSLDLATRAVTRLTDDAAEDGLPTYSPNGEYIAFVSDRGGAWGLWRMAPDGSDVHLIATLPGPVDGRVEFEPDYLNNGWLEEQISWSP